MDALKTDVMQDAAQAPRPGDLGAVPTDHPVLPIPFTAEIDGRHCLGEGLSLVRGQVAGLLDPALEGQERLVRLSFVFQGFTVALGVRCRITGVEGGKAVLVFTDPTGDHLPQLRHLLNGWIAGDLVSLGQILGVTTTPAKTGRGGTGAAAPGTGLAARLLGGTLMAAAAVALVGATLVLTYARGYTRTLPVPARVAAEGQVLTALAAGQIDYINPQAGRARSPSPCAPRTGRCCRSPCPGACSASLQGLVPGATVQAGDPVMTVHPQDAGLVATALVPAEMLFDLARAEAVTLTLPDGARLAATAQAPLPMPGPDGAALVPVTLRPLTPLPADLSGALAEVTLSRPVPCSCSLPARFTARWADDPLWKEPPHDGAIDLSPGAVRRHGVAALADVPGGPAQAVPAHRRPRLGHLLPGHASAPPRPRLRNAGRRHQFRHGPSSTARCASCIWPAPSSPNLSGANTGPAVLAAALTVLQEDPEALLLVLPSDHVVKGEMNPIVATWPSPR